jgi:hypothetical protein
MKLNFWQKLGILVFVIALVVIAWREMSGHNPTPAPAPTAPSPATGAAT